MGKSFQFMLLLMTVAILVCLSLWIIAAIGAMKLTDGCLKRYSENEAGMAINADHLSNTAQLKADANYSFSTGSETTGVQKDEFAYGKWLNTNLSIKEGQVIKFEIKGEVSLCRAYIPINNLQSNSATDINGKRIPIPRTDDHGTLPVALPFSAKIGEWRNLTEIYPNDHYVVSIEPDQKDVHPSISMKDWFSGGMAVADCREGKTLYSPLCGRFSIFGNQNYVSTCAWEPECTQCNCRDVCDSYDTFGACLSGWHNECDWCGCYKGLTTPAPEPYLSDGTFTSPWRASINDLFQNLHPDCASQSSYILDQYQNERFFWFSADNAAGLLYRMDSSAIQTNPTIRGSDFTIASIAADQSFHQSGEKHKILINKTHAGSIAYLQFRFIDDGSDWANHTGGYVLNIKQTKCRRSNGKGLTDTYEGRGTVEYVLMPYGQDPNDSGASLSVQGITVDNDGKGEITIPSGAVGSLWLKIKNNPDDYKDSTGGYQVQFSTDVARNDFFGKILNPVFETLKNKITNASQTIFKNMICYRGIGSGDGTQASCTNFFNYIKGLLTLYIMGYGFMFLLGVVQITQTDLIIRVIKIGLVAGLMNEGTFNFFNDYVFNLVTGFSDSIISNIGGYSMFTGSGGVTNPFTFLTALLSKIFLSKTFAAQMMAMIAMGINGVLYFIITFITLIMLIVVAFRAIAVYMMAFVAIAVLIGIAPLFLTFMLFEFTFYLFDNWIKFTVRYMLEPVIMMAGIIVLTQLFTIYLDYVTGYSVCWKCALPIQIPFPSIPGFNPAFLNVPLFCISWFAPWGFDHFSGVMGINIQHIIALMIIAYCLWGYIDFAGKVTGRLAGSAGGPSATDMGRSMSGSIEQNALKKVGLDDRTRAQIKQNAKERAANLSRGANRTSLDKGNRHDVNTPAGGAMSEGSKGEAAKGEVNSAAGTKPPSAAPGGPGASNLGSTAVNTPTSSNTTHISGGFNIAGNKRAATTDDIPTKKSPGFETTDKKRAATTDDIPTKTTGKQGSATTDSSASTKAAALNSLRKLRLDAIDAAQTGSGLQNDGKKRAATTDDIPTKGKQSAATADGKSLQSSVSKREATFEALRQQRATLVGGAPTPAERMDNINKPAKDDPSKPTTSSTEKTANTDNPVGAERKDNTKPSQLDNKKDSSINKDDPNKAADPSAEKSVNPDKTTEAERKDNTKPSQLDNSKKDSSINKNDPSKAVAPSAEESVNPDKTTEAERKDNTKPSQLDNKKDSSINKDDPSKAAAPSAEKPINPDKMTEAERKDNTKPSQLDNKKDSSINKDDPNKAATPPTDKPISSDKTTEAERKDNTKSSQLNNNKKDSTDNLNKDNPNKVATSSTEKPVNTDKPAGIERKDSARPDTKTIDNEPNKTGSPKDKNDK